MQGRRWRVAQVWHPSARGGLAAQVLAASGLCRGRPVNLRCLRIETLSVLVEFEQMWREYVDPADRDVALYMATDELGYTWLMFGDRRLSLSGPRSPTSARCALPAQPARLST
jgi:hypothetical protein